ncbi:MAG: hypothetical protein ACHQRJ_19260 [Alphaproteobacteria bacterium]
MPDTNPFRKVLEEEIGNRYSKVMEGIGRVAVAMSFAEFIIDAIGCRLTGNWNAYAALTHRMPLGTKVDRVREMCGMILLDPAARERAQRFCGDVADFIKHRNETVHSLYGQWGSHILRFKFPSRGEETNLTVTPEELFELADEIWSLASDNSSLAEALNASIQGQAETIRAMSRPDSVATDG